MTIISRYGGRALLRISFCLLASVPLAGHAQDGPPQEVFAP